MQRMARETVGWLMLFFLLGVVVRGLNKTTSERTNIVIAREESEKTEEKAQQEITTVPTFLGNSQRNFYGLGPVPQKLDIIWKANLGNGKTWTKGGFKTWSGSGWTGQPLIVEENGKPYIIQGAYDHHLRKIDGETGQVVWKYKFDDVIKGTGTIFFNEKARNQDERIIVLQGSRRGNQYSLASSLVPSFRAISFETGKELWRMDIPRTRSYSRDVDGSALVLNGLAYLGAENGIFYLIDPSQIVTKEGVCQSKILKEIKLYSEDDVKRHGGNLVIESSPALWNDWLIVTAGSGHVYGIDINTFKITWDFYIGADLNGSPVISDDGHIFVPVEKQYIQGPGGVFKLDPSKSPREAVVWYFPTGNRRFADWQGGVIGSVGINDNYNQRGTKPALAAFSAIDGNLYLVSQDMLAKEKVKGPDGKTLYPTPKKIFFQNIGGSISTPIFVGNENSDWLVAAGYNGVYLFRIDYLPAEATTPQAFLTKSGQFKEVKVVLLDHFKNGVSFESTPVVYYGRIYVGSRDGYLYCLGSAR